MAYTKKTFPKTEKAADKWKNWEFGKLKVTVTPSSLNGLDKEPSNRINIYNIDKDDAIEIVNKIKSLPNKVSANIWVDKLDPTHLMIKIFTKDANNWLDGGDLKAIQSVLYKSGKYDTNEVAHLEDQIASGIDTGNSDDTKEIASATEETAMDMWSRYLSTVNDKTTMDQLKLYRRIYKKMGVYGIILSIRNVDMIRTRMPNATFVTTKKIWEETFGRGVKRNAKKLPYWSFIPFSKNDDNEFEKAKQTTNWDNTSKSDLGGQVIRGIEKIASEGKGGRFMVSVGYDVSDTYLLDGAKEDKFNTQEGLLNNLTGELNRKAQAREDSLNAQDPNAPQISGQNENDMRTKMALDYMIDNAQKFEITPVNTGDNNNNLAEMIFQYCKNAATKKSNILNPANIQTYAQNATKIALILSKLALPALQKYNDTYNYSKKEAAALMNVVYPLVSMLEKNTILNEGIELLDKASFAKSFMSALKQIGCSVQNNNEAEMIKENFYKIYNKINANLF